MKLNLWILLIATLCFLISPPLPEAQQDKQDPRVELAIREARQISNELAEKVRSLLLQEVAKGGLGGALRVCSERAQEITREFNVDPGRSIRRVSLKYRNPNNIPDDYEHPKLEAMDRLNREKKLTSEYAEVVTDYRGRTLRYLKPLVVAPLCLNCHGSKEDLPAEIQAILSERYPGDRATGFRVDDLRGAISVKIRLD